ncbi:MAG: hypothetical protein OSA97_06900 [Nevskia sp.]|nr:hypothetical protein [Nevskia sp.]
MPIGTEKVTRLKYAAEQLLDLARTLSDEVASETTGQPISRRCDCCGYVATPSVDTDPKSKWEFQEFIYIEQYCGYGSIFDDGSTLAAYLCQHCLKKLLGPYLRVVRGGSD